MRGRGLYSFIKGENGGATVEFVAVFGPFLLITFFIFEIIIAVLWIGTAEKAVQLGARLAVVFNPAATGLPATNAVSAATVPPGAACGTTMPDNCATFGTLTCNAKTSAGCVAAALNLTWCKAKPIDCIVKRMSDVSGLITKDYVTITYSYVGLGFAGGPTIPSVTVTLQNVPYGAVVTTILGNFFAAGGGTSSLATLPPISVTLTAEDLSS
jgi:Flp pilus assembly protein TadG